MDVEVTGKGVLMLARAHSLALTQIPGLRLAHVTVHMDGDLFSTDLWCCIGYCPKCDSYWRTLRTSPGTIIEVVYVGHPEPPAPA